MRHCFVLEVLTNRLVSANASLSGAASLAILKHSPAAPQSLWHERGSPGRLSLHSPVKSKKRDTERCAVRQTPQAGQKLRVFSNVSDEDAGKHITLVEDSGRLRHAYLMLCSLKTL